MKISQLNQDIAKARQKESYRRLVAPVDGSVQGLKIHTPGAVVTTADGGTRLSRQKVPPGMRLRRYRIILRNPPRMSLMRAT